MKILPKPLEFEWDKGNINKNLKKHGVTDKESEEVFGNKPLLVSFDKKHSTRIEFRYNALGKTNQHQVLFISFTVRGVKARIISARQANRKERRKYVRKEEAQTDSYI